MTLAGHPLTFSVSATDGSYTEVDGINDISFGPTRDMLETTDFKDTSAAHTRMSGLSDVTVQISGDLENADTPQNLIRTQWGNGGALWTKILWDGSAGHKFQGIVETYTLKASTGGKVEFTATIKGNGAISAV